METYRVQVRLPAAILAMVQVEEDVTGETIASIVRRCIRQSLAANLTNPRYAPILADLYNAPALAGQSDER